MHLPHVPLCNVPWSTQKVSQTSFLIWILRTVSGKVLRSPNNLQWTLLLFRREFFQFALTLAWGLEVRCQDGQGCRHVPCLPLYTRWSRYFCCLEEGFINMVRLSLRTLSEVVRGTRTSACSFLPLCIKNNDLDVFLLFERGIINLRWLSIRTF